MTLRPGVQLFMASASAFTLDRITKAWAEQALELQVPRSVVGDALQLTLGYNTGIAFGVFADGDWLLLLISGVAILALTLWSIKTVRMGSHPSPAWALGLILGGAIANFIDRVPDARVTDFLDAGIGTSRWPTFNFADSAIVVGVAALLLTSVIGTRSPTREQIA